MAVGLGAVVVQLLVFLACALGVVAAIIGGMFVLQMFVRAVIDALIAGHRSRKGHPAVLSDDDPASG
ncbi:Na+/melibiose symporter-like transporter [Microbacterium testaceum]|uniref:hypothetical protein n=1 Tax=Microbacterium testaceum TaxID=2033 RepID=UPI00277E6707|nr:hypothetical protein [Microbacterium testaceum]MDQ1171872.1 Na+/melibiose symporter-like transporter [Microbacterium testaceum]